MYIEQKTADGLESEFVVTLLGNEVKSRIQKWLADRQKNVKIDGFRPGKVPFSMMEKRYGEQARREILENYVDESSKKIIINHKLRPIGQPVWKVESKESDENFVFSVAFESFPTFEIDDFSKIKLDRLIYKIDEEEIQKDLDHLLESIPSYEKSSSDHEIKPKNLVVFDMESEFNNRKIKDFSGKDLQIVIGVRQEGLEYVHNSLIGKNVGDSFSFNHSFSKDFQDKKIAGREIDFFITVKEVKIPEPSILNDDFAKKLGYLNLEELKAERVKKVQQEKNQLIHFYHKRKVLDVFESSYDFDLPKRMLTQEFDSIWAKFKQEFREAKEKGSLSKEDIGKKEEDYKDEYEKIARRRVKLGILVAEIAHRNKIFVSEQMLSRLIMNEARKYPGQEREVMNYYKNKPEALEALKSPAIEDMVVELVLEKAQTKDVEVDSKQLKKKLSGILPEFDENNEDESNDKNSSKKSPPKKKNTKSKEK